MAGAQYDALAAGSEVACAKLAASGVTFQETASANALRQTSRGRQLRSESRSTATGIAA